MQYKIMVADDDAAILRAVDFWLKKAGYAVIRCESGNEVVFKIRESNPDLLMMDVLLGDADGMRLCRQLRGDPATRHIPLILMSGTRVKEEDMVSGLDGGADDYLFKPLSAKVLIAKIEAVLRRMRAPKELREVLGRYGLKLRVSEHGVKVGGKNIRLTRKEFDLLTVLLRKRGQVLSTRFLLETVWGYEMEDYNDPHTLQVHLSRLKKKVGPEFASQIENVIGSGYRLK